VKDLYSAELCYINIILRNIILHTYTLYTTDKQCTLLIPVT